MFRFTYFQLNFLKLVFVYCIVNLEFKHITTSILTIILIATVLTLNVPLLANVSCDNMKTGSCTCKNVNEEKSCCEKTSQIKITINSSNHCGCYISEANNKADFYDNQITAGNKFKVFENTFYSVNLIYHHNNSFYHGTHIHSPPLISNSPVYISIHSLLI